MIRVEVTQTDLSKAASALYRKSSGAGIDAAGQFFMKELKRSYSNYYLSQRFRNTIFIKDNITAARPEMGRTGWYTMVGVPSQMVVPRGQTEAVDRGAVALAWELGHYNEMVGATVRVPIAVPAAAKYAQQIVDTFARTVVRIMGVK